MSTITTSPETPVNGPGARLALAPVSDDLTSRSGDSAAPPRIPDASAVTLARVADVLAMYADLVDTLDVPDRASLPRLLALDVALLRQVAGNLAEYGEVLGR